MLVYSENIVHFIHTIKSQIKLILKTEIGLFVHGERFYDKEKKASYPIKVVIYDDQTNLGYFNPNFYELGFHESVMQASKEVLTNLIRHELGHYLTYILYGSQVQSHGPEYRDVCKSFGWGKEIYEATTSLDVAAKDTILSENNMARKIKKLLALSSSSNKHEAELAMLKSRELLLTHHIDNALFEEPEEKMFLSRVMEEKKRNAKMVAISQILETFFVSSVFHKGADSTYLEIMGTKLHIEIATYAARFLEHELESLWEESRKKTPLKGSLAKNSFFLGIAKGYCQKIDSLKNHHSSAILVIENSLREAKKMAYGKLSHIRKGHKYCQKSDLLGKQAGSNLTIHKGVTDSSYGKLAISM
jgi:hypothetical protein